MLRTDIRNIKILKCKIPDDIKCYIIDEIRISLSIHTTTTRYLAFLKASNTTGKQAKNKKMSPLLSRTRLMDELTLV